MEKYIKIGTGAVSIKTLMILMRNRLSIMKQRDLF